MKKFKSFKNNENYEILGKIHLRPSTEQIKKWKAKTPTMRRCLDCFTPVNAFMDRCPYCKGTNFKIVGD